jgi:O-6-methylguanine DNA methyltransferase
VRKPTVQADQRLVATPVGTPVGMLTLVAAEHGLRRVLWGDLPSEDVVLDPRHPILAVARTELTRYFEGRLRRFTVPLDLRGSTFQQHVWTEVARVPFGKTVTYSEIPRSLGVAHGARAVGSAKARNPVPIVVPCQSSGRLGWSAARIRRRYCRQGPPARARAATTNVVKLGLQLTDLERAGATVDLPRKLADVAAAADAAGVYSLWLPDHLLNAMSVFGQPIDAPVLEAQTTLSYLSGQTRDIKLGVLCSCNLFRPALLVKTVSTIDVLSGGRAYFGVGTGWFEREARALAILFPPQRERLDRLEETLQIAKHIWRGTGEPFFGRFSRLEEPLNNPGPVSRPHPPILVGGSGERRLLRLVAQYADACNLFAGSYPQDVPASWRDLYEARIPTVARKLSILREHCDTVGRVGRPYAEIEEDRSGIRASRRSARQRRHRHQALRRDGGVGRRPPHSEHAECLRRHTGRAARTARRRRRLVRAAVPRNDRGAQGVRDAGCRRAPSAAAESKSARSVSVAGRLAV